jgi:hypothetical protein
MADRVQQIGCEFALEKGGGGLILLVMDRR